MTPHHSAGKEETEDEDDPDGGNCFRHVWPQRGRDECGYPKESKAQTVARLERQVKFHPGLAGELARLKKGTKR